MPPPTTQEGHLKARVYFNTDLAPEGTVSSEAFWVTPLPQHPATRGDKLAARVENLLLWAPFTLGDIVTVSINTDEDVQVVGIVERSPHVSVGVSFTPDDPEDPVVEASAGIITGNFTEAAERAGGKAERLTPTLTLIQLPDEGLRDTGSIIGWLESVITDIVDFTLSEFTLGFEVMHLPNAPMQVDWIDTNLERPHISAPPMVDNPWDAQFDEQFLTAIQRARSDGHIPDWADNTAVIATASELWVRDDRVRVAVGNGRLWQVAVFAFRISAPLGTVFPPLDEPLL